MELTTQEKKEVITNEKIVGYLNTFGMTNLTEQETMQFIEIAVAYQLNPFKREIYCVPYVSNVKDENGKWTKERKLSIITGFEVYLKRAERTGKLNGWNVTTAGKIQDETFRAVITIHRTDWTHPLVHEVYFKEYKRDSKIWNEKPVTMIKKVAISSGFRMAFPDEFAGMPYAKEEMPEDMTEDKINEKPIIINELTEAQKQEIASEESKQAANEKINNLSEEAKAFFKKQKYTKAMIFSWCEERVWDEELIARDIKQAEILQKAEVE